MKKLPLFTLIPLLISFFIAGCATQTKVDTVVQVEPPPPPKTLTSRGYGTVSREQQYSLTPAQRKLMAIRASKMDAVRELAEQVYGIRIHGHTTVEDMTTKSDSFRTYVDAFLRGARVRTTMASGVDRDTYETVMELDLTPTFYQCLLGSGQCAYQQNLTEAQPIRAPAPPSFYAPPVKSECNSEDCYGFPDTHGFSPH